jgi:hypothetical protein
MENTGFAKLIDCFSHLSQNMKANKDSFSKNEILTDFF